MTWEERVEAMAEKMRVMDSFDSRDFTMRAPHGPAGESRRLMWDAIERCATEYGIRFVKTAKPYWYAVGDADRCRRRVATRRRAAGRILERGAAETARLIEASVGASDDVRKGLDYERRALEAMTYARKRGQ